jgi:hypothetical protein
MEKVGICTYSMVIWNLLQSFGIFKGRFGNLVAIWYIFTQFWGKYIKIWHPCSDYGSV